MKKLAAFLCAAVAVVAGVAYTPAFSASAASLTLSSQQTLALFGNKLKFNYNVGDLAEDGSFQFVESYLDFYGFGNITNQTYTDGAADNVVNHPVIVYRSRNSYSNNYSSPVVKVNPVIDISKLNYFKFSAGFSSPRDSFSNTGTYFSFADADNTCIKLYKNTIDPSALQTFPIKWYNYYGQAYVNEVLVNVDSSPVEDLSNYYPSFIATNIQAKVEDSSGEFSVIMDGNESSAVIMQAKNASAPGIKQNPNLFNSYLYFYVECPVLSDTYEYSAPPDPESSGGGSDSSTGGYDGPDYSEQLALILAKLDLIINNDFNFDVDLSADVSGLESRLDGVNSRLDVNNSRLDGVTGRLDGANSRLDGVNSRLDNISAELHDMNSAPNESLPDTGGENSEFEHQADMYMQDFRNEYEDSENQVFEVIDKGTGFLGFVRDMLITSHLAQILPLLALLFIAHYVIFERGG